MYSLRPLAHHDNAAIARIIREVSQEYGLAPESGFSVADPILDDLYTFYQQEKAAYWVIEDQHGDIFGGGGIAPLSGATHILEIQKMYFSSHIRGQGLAKKILNQAFEFAHKQGSTTIYLETTALLKEAVHLYEALGFQHLSHPLGMTGHSIACEIWMAKKL